MPSELAPSAPRSRRRVVGAIVFGIGLLVLLGGAWVAVTGLMARAQLQSARSEIGRLRTQLDAGQLAAARATAVDIAEHGRRAHELTTGPAWAILAAVPAGGEPFATTRAITSQVNALGSDVLPSLVAASRRLDPATLRAPGGRIRIARIAALAPTLRRADTAVQDSTRVMRAQPADTWLSPVDAARRSFITQLSELERTIRSADLAASIAPQMLGEHGTKRYFVAFQNEAEARGTGGTPGAFAIVSVTQGKIRFERFEPDTYLQTQPTHLDFGRDYNQLLVGARSTSFYVNANITPQFSYAARIWIAMWHHRTGQQLDGAVAIDPTALSYLLAVTGPAPLPGGGQVSADNVVALTQSTVYMKFPKIAQKASRKNYLLAAAKAAAQKALTGGTDATAVLRAAGEAAGQRRLLIYSTDAAVERQLGQTSLSGDIPVTTHPYVGLAVVNVAGNKLDYYLHRTLTWQRTGCGAQRDVTVTARLNNDAPAHGLSPYVTERNDYFGHPTRPGDNRLAVYYYATAGARLSSLTINGRLAPATTGTLVGHPVFVADVEMPRGRTRNVVFHLSEPAGQGQPLILDQPGVNPLHVSIRDAKCP